jgi:hypothetical protein
MGDEAETRLYFLIFKDFCWINQSWSSLHVKSLGKLLMPSETIKEKGLYYYTLGWSNTTDSLIQHYLA